MSLPPALTWLELFPRGTGVVCPEGPVWMDELLRQHQGQVSTPTVQVVCGKSFDQLGDLSRWQGVVALNCPGIAPSDFERAGFTYVRRFSVVPGLPRARWLICRDSRSVASSAFAIYSPSRFSARLKRRVARLAAWMGLPLWCDTITLAARKPPPLEDSLRRLFPDREVRLGLSSGAPEPALNRKVAAIVLGLDGAVLGFVKIAGSDLSRRIMEREAQVMPELGSCPGVSVPTLLHAGEIDGRYVTVQSPLAGVPAPARLTAAHHRFLDALRRGPLKPASLTRMVQDLPGRIAALPDDAHTLADALDRLVPVLERTTVPSTIVHGDFAPWNVRLDRGRLAAFDWEYAELDGLPLIDQTHFAIQVGREFDRWDIDRALLHLAEAAARRPLGLNADQVAAMHAIYLIDGIVRLLSEGYNSDDEMVKWYQALLNRLVAPQAQAVLA